MGLFRRLGQGASVIVALVMLAPVAALPLAAVWDRGPSGKPRATLFPAALTLLDPFFWTCFGNSIALAAAVAVGSLLIGVGLARVVVRHRFRGRRLLSALAIGPLMAPPLFGALGLRLVFGPSGPWRGAWEQLGGLPFVNPRWDGWIGAFWIGLTTGAPLVALATAHALARIDPVVEDAARLEGATRSRTWRRVIWPQARPAVARAVAAVFTMTLAEPGAPLLLGLRRTLGFQLVEAALNPEPAPRAAVLALATLGCALIVRGLLLLWGGRPTSLPDSPRARAEPASPLRGLVFLALLAGAVVLAWLPMLGVIGTAFTPAPDDPSGGMRLTVAAFASLFRDPTVRRFALNSVGLGLAVLALALAARPSLRRLAFWPEAVPPLVLGIGAVVLPTVVRLGSGSASVFEPLANALQTPGVLLVLTVATLRAPFLSRLWKFDRDRSPPAPRDAARQLGVAYATARRLASSTRRSARAGAYALTFALAAANLAPALVLATNPAARTIAPAILHLADAPGAGDQQICALAVCALVLNLAALAIALAGRPADAAFGEVFRSPAG